MGWVITLITILTFVVASATFILMYWDNRKQQLAILRSLFQHVLYAKNTATSQYNQLRQIGAPPSWTLIEFDLNFYLPRINYSIRKEWSLEKIYTKELKEEIVKVADVVNKINNILNLIYNAEVSRQNEMKRAYINELITKPYYPEIFEFSENTLRYLRGILKPIKRKYLVWY